ncbi:hypothetical protein HK098_004178 [Nowakowskiella sp. JEL0407]|nr:hypothetical protein HK098_004178 [Nowakowskiella sp. JEL0407]
MDLKTESRNPVSATEPEANPLINSENEAGLNADPEVLHQEYDEFTCLLGCIAASSNFYLGLKVGWTFGASIFASIFSFGILKPLSNLLPAALGGRYFGPRENVTAQTAASTSGGLSVGMITAIPAMYRLGLLSNDVSNDILRLSLWTVVASSYGMFFVVPLRKNFCPPIGSSVSYPSPNGLDNQHSPQLNNRIQE